MSMVGDEWLSSLCGTGRGEGGGGLLRSHGPADVTHTRFTNKNSHPTNLAGIHHNTASSNQLWVVVDASHGIAQQ